MTIKFPIFCILFLSLCSKSEKEEVSDPVCVLEIIDLESNRDYSSLRAVYRFKSEMDTYYELEAQCCDFFNYILNSECDTICATGGLTGQGDGKCPDFGEVEKREVVWESDGNRLGE